MNHNSTNPIRQLSSASQRLLIEGPILTLLASLKADVVHLRELLPSSEAIPALERHAARLEQAIGEARDTDAWVSTETAAAMRGCTPQAITALCRQDKITARKRGGIWEVHKDDVLADTRRKRAS